MTAFKKSELAAESLRDQAHALQTLVNRFSLDEQHA
jgi:hypothetical protein